MAEIGANPVRSEQRRGGRRPNVSCNLGGGETYYKVRPPKPLLEASESGIGLSGVNKSARERIGRQNVVPESPLQKGVFGSHIFSKEL